MMVRFGYDFDSSRRKVYHEVRDLPWEAPLVAEIERLMFKNGTAVCPIYLSSTIVFVDIV
jgi:hypothetical protein